MRVSRSFRLTALAAGLGLVTACSAPSDSSGNATAAAPTASTAASAAAGIDADGLLSTFLAAHGEDIEACFADMPAPETGADTPDLTGPGRDDRRGPGRVVVALDASGSMAARAGGATKMDAAKHAASDFIASLPADTAVGLLAFGHRGSNRREDKAASCAAAEAVHPVGAIEPGAVQAALDGFDARGWTPLAAAIRAAGGMLPEGAGPTAVYVVSDGEDTCGGDPVAAARALHEGGTRAVVNVIGFDLPAADRAQLRAVAEAGGGVFTELDLDRAGALADELRRSNRNFIERLQASNANAGRVLRNSNRTFAAGLKLGNCVNGKTLRERNALHRWTREQSLDNADAVALEAALHTRHTEFETRAEALVGDADRATRAANDRIEAVQAAQDRETRR